MAHWRPCSKEKWYKSACDYALSQLARLSVDKLLKSIWTYIIPKTEKSVRSSRRVLDMKLPV